MRLCSCLCSFLIPAAPLRHPSQRNRKRMGPLAVSPSTTLPFCTISILPAFTSRRAAAFVAPIKPSQSRRVSVPPTSFAASDGQIVIPTSRSASSSRIASSSAASASPALYPRQASLQYFITSQSFSHSFRQANARPQVLHNLSLCGVVRSRFRTLSGIVNPQPSLYLKTTCPFPP